PLHRIPVDHRVDAWPAEDLRVPGLLLPAVEACERDNITTDLVHQIAEERRRQPLTLRYVRADRADDGRESLQVTVVRRHRCGHHAPQTAAVATGRITAAPVLTIRRTSDGCRRHGCAKSYLDNY